MLTISTRKLLYIVSSIHLQFKFSRCLPPEEPTFVKKELYALHYFYRDSPLFSQFSFIPTSVPILAIVFQALRVRINTEVERKTSRRGFEVRAGPSQDTAATVSRYPKIFQGLILSVLRPFVADTIRERLRNRWKKKPSTSCRGSVGPFSALI